ncbi:MAG TPA: hypothetical protein VGI92_04280 [Gemmatimonadales bacterium]|jgi:hypothetical protein
MSRLLFVAVMLAAVPGRLFAQADEQLRQAIRRYENLDIDRARTMFEQVISPSSPFQVTEAQRVTAYKYLGATYATLGKADSAKMFFKAALSRDPLVDLDPRAFGEQERQTFQQARLEVFRVGLRPIPRDTIDPRSGHVNITVATTHGGHVRVELRSADDETQRVTLFDGAVEGPRDISFNGLNPRDGSFIPPGAYDVVVLGEDTVRASAIDSTSALIEIGWDRAPLADTIASLGANDTLPTRLPSSTATRELVLGVGLAATAILASKVIGQSDLEGRGALSAAVAGAGVMGGIYAYLHRRNHPEIPANVAENAARQQRRAAVNGRIMAENTTRIQATKVIIRPLGQ